MTNKANVQKNTVFNMMKSVAAIIFPLISFPYASRVLLADNLGKVNFGNSIVSYFNLLAGLGITTYAIRECSKVKDDREKLENTASQLYSINIITTVLAYIALFGTLLIARPLEQYRTLIVIQSITIGLTTIGADWINNVMEDFKFITIRTITFQALSLLLLLILVRSPEDYLIYAGITVISNGGANIINAFYRKKYCRLRLTITIEWKKHFPPILWLFSMLIAQTIYVNSDTTILGLIKGDFQVGLYSVSVKVYNIVQTLVNSVTYAVLPQLSYWFAKKNYEKVNSLLRYGFNFTIAIGLPCIVGMFVIAPELILLIAGEEYVGAVTSLRILSVALGASFIAGFIGNMIMIPSGRDKLCMVSSCVSAVVNLVLNLLFIPRWGLNAAASTTAISQILGFLIKVPFVEKEISLGDKKSIFLGPIVGSFAMPVIAYFARRIIGNLILRTLMIIGLCIAIYCIILLLFRNDIALIFYDNIKREVLKDGER